MNNLMIFENKQVEVFEWEGKVLFNPYHCGECLNLSPEGVRKAITRMNDKQVIKLTNSKVTDSNFRKLHNTGENFLTESGVYKLIFKSNKTEAEKFQDWVTDEVLPSIRKIGSYNTKKITKERVMDIIDALQDDEYKNEAIVGLLRLISLEKRDICEPKLNKKKIEDILNKFLRNHTDAIIKQTKYGLAVNKTKLYRYFENEGIGWTETLRLLDQYGFIYHREGCRTVQVRVPQEKNAIRVVIIKE